MPGPDDPLTQVAKANRPDAGCDARHNCGIARTFCTLAARNSVAGPCVREERLQRFGVRRAAASVGEVLQASRTGMQIRDAVRRSLLMGNQPISHGPQNYETDRSWPRCELRMRTGAIARRAARSPASGCEQIKLLRAGFSCGPPRDSLSDGISLGCRCARGALSGDKRLLRRIPPANFPAELNEAGVWG